MRRIALLFLCSMFSSIAHSAPEIKVGAMHEYVAADKSTHLKRIRNRGDSTAFVKVTVEEIVYDATSGAAKEQPVAAVAADKTSQQDTLIASPARLIIPANGMQATRLLALGPRLEERYFRVRFIPVLPENRDGFSMDSEQATQYKDSLSAGITMLTGYGIIAIVHPRDARYDTQLQDLADSYVIRNAGNSTIVLENYTACGKQDSECREPAKIHVRPGQTHSIEKQAEHRYRFDLIEGDRKKTVTFKT